ncbi:MAG: DUF523 domain-containing protein [Eubacterium sp.]|nr:DUF523 domain-containing protein [Eubacterium sp.]
MKIMVSACLAGENCKYNGGNNRNEKTLQLMSEHEVITVCPEQMGGLPTPRVSSEIKDGIVTFDSNDTQVTEDRNQEEMASMLAASAAKTIFVCCIRRNTGNTYSLVSENAQNRCITYGYG